MILFDEIVTKERVLMVLYNFADHISFDVRMKLDPNCEEMTEEVAIKMLEKSRKFSSIKGRIVPLDLTSDIGFDETYYDKRYGSGRTKHLVEKFIVEANSGKTI